MSTEILKELSGCVIDFFQCPDSTFLHLQKMLVDSPLIMTCKGSNIYLSLDLSDIPIFDSYEDSSISFCSSPDVYIATVYYL